MHSRACRLASRRFTAAAPLSLSNISPNVIAAQYAVRGEIVQCAMEHASALARGEPRPFKSLLYCNIGNPQDLGQQPLTFFRQVLALVNWSELLSPANAAHAGALFPADAMARARRYTEASVVGAYSHSQGIPLVREEVAEFLRERDGVHANASDLFLTDGASPAARMLMSLLIRGPKDGVMVPVPQYPLYSATIALHAGKRVDYFLKEEKCWSLEMEELERSYSEASAAGTEVRAIVVINPGNPTGGVLNASNILDVAKFAAARGLLVIADEVYQSNIWDSSKQFVSFKKVAVEAGLLDPHRSEVARPGGLQLASLQSTSKGFVGECGRRGGYMEVCGVDAGVRGELYKLASLNLCSNTTGQLLMGLQCRPPVQGEESWPLYQRERDGILASLARRASRLNRAMRAMEGASCQPAEGAMYAFPQIRLPQRALQAAREAGKAADTFYCLQLLEEKGIVVVPGSGFGQAPGTLHFRATILPPEEDIETVCTSLQAFHASFMDRYR